MEKCWESSRNSLFNNQRRSLACRPCFQTERVWPIWKQLAQVLLSWVVCWSCIVPNSTQVDSSTPVIGPVQHGGDFNGLLFGTKFIQCSVIFLSPSTPEHISWFFRIFSDDNLITFPRSKGDAVCCHRLFILLHTWLVFSERWWLITFSSRMIMFCLQMFNLLEVYLEVECWAVLSTSCTIPDSYENSTLPSITHVGWSLEVAICWPVNIDFGFSRKLTSKTRNGSSSCICATSTAAKHMLCLYGWSSAVARIISALFVFCVLQVSD